MYEERFYREDFSKEWFSYEISIKETDILVKSPRKLKNGIISESVKKYRKDIEDYIHRFPEFETTLSAFKPKDNPALIVKEMIKESALLDVGPMATVAGAIAQFLGKDLLNYTSEIIVENGGDIFIRKQGVITLGIYAGENNFINDFLLSLDGGNSSLGVCSSSSFLGHSLSLGRADLATVVAESAIFADGLATKLANMVTQPEDIEKAVEFSRKLPQVLGVLVVKADRIGLWGKLKLLK